MNLMYLTIMEKQVVGSIFGSANIHSDIPKLLKLYREGQLDLDSMITTTYKLGDINQGYQDMRDGKNIRGVLLYERADRSRRPLRRPPLRRSRVVAQMSLQRSHTSAGTTPARISRPKAMQPRHTAKTDSKSAAARAGRAPPRPPSRSRERSGRAPSARRPPMPWANRLGGPGTGRRAGRAGGDDPRHERASGLSGVRPGPGRRSRRRARRSSSAGRTRWPAPPSPRRRRHQPGRHLVDRVGEREELRTCSGRPCRRRSSPWPAPCPRLENLAAGITGEVRPG